MSTISCRSSIAPLDCAVKLAYAGVWILCRTRRRRLGETGCNAEFMTAMGGARSSAWHHINPNCGKVSNEENQKYHRRQKYPGARLTPRRGADLAGSPQKLSLTQAGDAGDRRHHEAGKQLHGSHIALVECPGGGGQHFKNA